MNKTKIVVVIGSPFSGKSSYVRDNLKENDLVFDFDKIMGALSGYQNIHDKNKNLISYVLKIREMIVDKLKTESKLDTAYIIMTKLNDSFLKDLDYELVEMNISREECISRVNSSNRNNKEFWIDLINKFYDEREEERMNFNEQKMELRMTSFELTENSNGEMIVEGLVNRTNSWSQTLGQRKKFKERILPNAFRSALSRAKQVNLLFEHNPSDLLASTKNGSLELFEDSEGLKMRAKLVSTTLGKDVHALVKSGLIDNMSFGFRTIKDSWKKLNDGTYLRDVLDLDLFEVSIVKNPAYLQSAVSARSNILEDVEIPEDCEEVRSEEETTQEVVVNEEVKVEETVTETAPVEAPVVEETKEEAKTEEVKAEEASTTNDVAQDMIAKIKEELKAELLKQITSEMEAKKELQEKTEESTQTSTDEVVKEETAPTTNVEDTKVEETKKPDSEESTESLAQTQENNEETNEEVSNEPVQVNEKTNYSQYYKELLSLK